jgi:hypothetical protein
MKSAWDTIETSVGPLDIKACARNYFNIKNPKESNFLLATVTRQRKGWEIDGTRADGSKPDNDLLQELLRLGIAWADEHPEDFERAAEEEFKRTVETTVDFSITEVVFELGEALKDVTSVLREEEEFRRQASPALRRQYQEAARMLREMRSKAKSMMKSITQVARLSAEEAT